MPDAKQGPNEQSIVASGMTVEEWKKKHPGRELGPSPEDVGQMVTDPPDGSEPQPPFPGTGTSVDPDGTLSSPPEEESPAPAPVPEPEEVEGEEVEGEEVEGEEEDAPWDSMSTHAAIDAYASSANVATPADWPSMTLAAKRTYLDENA